MVLHDHVDSMRFAKFRKTAQTLSGVGSLLFVSLSFAVSIHADGMTAEKLCGLHPLLVIVDHLLALCFVGFAEMTFAVDHDEHALHPEVVASFLEFGEVLLVLGLVLEELVDVLEGRDAKLLFGDLGEIEIGHLVFTDGPVQGPFRERDFKEGLALLVVIRLGEKRGEGESGCGCALLEEETSVHGAQRVGFSGCGARSKRALQGRVVSWLEAG